MPPKFSLNTNLTSSVNAPLFWERPHPGALPYKAKKEVGVFETHLIAKPLLDSTTISQAKDVENNSKVQIVYLKHATTLVAPSPPPSKRNTSSMVLPTLLLEKQEVVFDKSTCPH
jgi:hypothetical protein